MTDCVHRHTANEGSRVDALAHPRAVCVRPEASLPLSWALRTWACGPGDKVRDETIPKPGPSAERRRPYFAIWLTT